MILGRVFRKAMRLYRTKADPVGYARTLGVRVGQRCRFIDTSEATFGSEPYLIRIGDHVTITAGVKFITHDGGVWVFRDDRPNVDLVAPVVVGNNVFIGIGAVLMPGVTVGDNCVIGAASVVTRDVPSGSVVAGIPARVVKTMTEYRTTVDHRGLAIRDLPPKQKRKFLEERFAAVLEG